MTGHKSTDLKSLFSLPGRTAIVTGGSIGVGEQICHGLAEAGANIVVCARNVARCEELAHAIEDRHKVSALAVRCDVSDERDVENVVAEAVGKYGAIDVLVNNAGITWGAEYHQMALKHWQKVLDTNLNGTFLFCKHAGRHMIPRRSGKVINISSILGMYGHRTLVAPSYTASKAAINGFTLDLAVKWARHNITVNAVAPGWYPSNMTGSVMKKMNDELLAPIPLGRYLGDSDIKGVVVFLSAPASDFITGQVIVVDGGEML